MNTDLNFRSAVAKYGDVWRINAACDEWESGTGHGSRRGNAILLSDGYVSAEQHEAQVMARLVETSSQKAA